MNTKTALVLGAAGLLLGYLVYRAAKQGLEAAAQAINPVSDKNLAYRGVNAVGEAITGDKEFSLGSWLYDVFNPEYDPNAPAPLLQTRKQAVGDQFYDTGYFGRIDRVRMQ